MNKKIKAGILLLINCVVILAACSPKTELLINSTPQLTMPPSLFAEDVYEVKAWVELLAPQQGERVLVSGSLIKNGVYLGGMAMEARWPDKEKDDRIADCVVQVVYQRGLCLIDTSGYSPGEFVPITILFRHAGGEYIGQTGFTPQER